MSIEEDSEIRKRHVDNRDRTRVVVVPDRQFEAIERGQRSP
jgi:hypothetical protein